MKRTPSPFPLSSLSVLGRVLASFTATLVLVFTLAMMGLGALSLAGCGPDAARVTATTAVVGAGSAVRALRDENERVYAAAVDRARTSSPDRTTYDAAVRSIDATFDARTRALVIASTALYASAALIDDSRGGDAGLADYIRAAVDAASTLRSALAILTAPSSGMPPLTVPAEVNERLRALDRAAVAPGLDAGP